MQWLKVAQQSSYAEFAKDVPDGKKLIDAALASKSPQSARRLCSGTAGQR